MRVCVIGAGSVAQGLVHLLSRVEGFRPAIIVNRTPAHGVAAYTNAGVRASDVVVADDERTARSAVAARRPTVTANPGVALALDDLDVVVEATGALDFGAEVVLEALQAGRSVVSVNAEVDAAIGWLLHVVAAAHGGIYTICDGDQPGQLMRTLDRVAHMHFDVVAAVNCKRHLDVHQSSATSAAFAARDGTSVPITVAAGDGTKMNIEQAIVANLAGLPPDCRGMHGVPTTLAHVVEDVRQAISRDGVVEYTLGGDFGAGVLVVVRAPEPERVQRSLRFFKLGDGPEYAVFEAHTLVHFEMPRSIAEVVLDRAPLWSPAGPPVADVVAMAKRDLRPGDVIDGIGGDLSYGQIDTIEGAAGLLPIVLADRARVVRPVPMDEPIPLDAVEVDDTAPIARLRQLQDRMVAATR
jgi:predicted homoserine dehydrogenase-like protein